VFCNAPAKRSGDGALGQRKVFYGNQNLLAAFNFTFAIMSTNCARKRRKSRGFGPCFRGSPRTDVGAKRRQNHAADSSRHQARGGWI